MKKVEEKKVEKKQKPKVIETKSETREEVSVKEMIHGKRKVQENKLGCPHVKSSEIYFRDFRYFQSNFNLVNCIIKSRLTNIT